MKVIIEILDLMTLTDYTSTIQVQIIITSGTQMKKVRWKRKKLKNKSSDCNTRFEDTYHLYKYNIGIDYHHIMNRDEKRQMKKEKLNNKSSDCNIRFDDTYFLYKYNIDIDYRHIRNR